MSSPTLYKTDQKGAIRSWKIFVEAADDGITYNIVTISGIVGKKQTRHETNVATGKYLNKANETTVEEQAIKEAKSKYAKKKLIGYVDDESEVGKVQITPMLLRDYSKFAKKPEYPLFIQRKHDGARCLVGMTADDGVKLYGRNQIEIVNFPHIVADFTEIYANLPETSENIWFDGELYHHGTPLQEINGLVSKKTNLNSKGNVADRVKISLFVFDMFDTEDLDIEYRDRYAYLQENIPDTLESVRVVDGEPVRDEGAMKDITEGYVLEGYEGSLLRTGDGKYKYGNRSPGVWKFKFPDIGYAVITDITKVTNGIVFMVDYPAADDTVIAIKITGSGTVKYKNYILEHKDNYIGATIKFGHYGKTKAGKPKFSTPMLGDDKKYIISLEEE